MIQQGHKYRQRGEEVIALHPCEFGGWIVGVIAGPWFLRKQGAMPDELEPLPMKYFGGEVPSAVQA